MEYVILLRFHFACFWKRVKSGTINEASIRGMDWLKWEDQEKIREKIKNKGLCYFKNFMILFVYMFVFFCTCALVGRSFCSDVERLDLNKNKRKSLVIFASA